MTEANRIVVPRESVNDESATLIAWTSPAGSQVTAGQVIAQIETSKAVMNLAAPFTGTLRIKARVGDEIPIGDVIGWIVDNEPDTLAIDAIGAEAVKNGRECLNSIESAG